MRQKTILSLLLFFAGILMPLYSHAEEADAGIHDPIPSYATNEDPVTQKPSSGDPASPDFVGPPAPSSAGTSGAPMLADPNFKLDPSTFSPSTKSYTAGSGNIANMIGDLVRLMLIAISTLAVISIAIGGAMMSASGGNTDRVSKGKAIVIHSLQALMVSLSAYLIIKFVSWVIG